MAQTSKGNQQDLKVEYQEAWRPSWEDQQVVVGLSLSRSSKSINSLNEERTEDNIWDINKIPLREASRIQPLQNHYPRPSPPDVRHDDHTHTKAQYDGVSIISLNIDGYSDYQCMTTFQEMMMAEAAYVNISDCIVKDDCNMLTGGFAGILRSWWANQLSSIERNAILDAKKIKTEVNGATKKEPGTVNKFVYILMKHLCITKENQAFKAEAGLNTLKCHNMEHFKYYKDTFLIRLYQHTDCGLAMFKQFFIDDLPNYVRKKFYESQSTNK